MKYLARTQRADGSWLPLWFGNQHMPDDENPTYGTARVLAAYRDLGMMNTEPAKCGIAWLAQNQNPDGGWGGGRGSPSSIEETALALDVLVDVGDAIESVNKGIAWLVEKIEQGGLSHPRRSVLFREVVVLREALPDNLHGLRSRTSAKSIPPRTDPV